MTHPKNQLHKRHNVLKNSIVSSEQNKKNRNFELFIDRAKKIEQRERQ